MKSFIVLFFVALCFASVALAAMTNADVEVLKQFHAFETKYNKQYDSPGERFHRIGVFAVNLERVKFMNEEHGTPVFGVTKFMDLTPEEFKAKYLTLSLPDRLPEMPFAEAPLANSTQWDWGINKTGIITAVKNQEQCGSCWAFSATESVESAWALAGNTLQTLAPQQIVDCDTGGVDQGCNGGYPYDAFKYVIRAGGMEPEVDYPYRAVEGTCKFAKSKVVASITSWHLVSQAAATENTKMLNYVANSGPVSICVDASSWQYYTGGVLRRCGNQIDHAVQATGYSVVQGVNAWNVRNSWGADWGVNGYIYLERGINLCEIATIVTAATAPAS